MKTKLQKMREARGLTVEELADKILEPFRNTYIEMIKDNERQSYIINDDLPEDKSWDKLLAKALNCTVADLVEVIDE